MSEQEPRREAGLADVRAPEQPPPAGGSGHRGRRRAPLAERIRGPWRVAVTEPSMAPAILPGDWLLVDPTVGRWPRRGSVVVFREPDTDELAVKRVAAVPGDRVELDAGYLVLGDDEAWVLSDASLAEAAEWGAGTPVDSRRYGPVPIDLLVGRAWFRYGPLRRIGRLASASRRDRTAPGETR